jgi:ABC-2 type transport system permease protein
MIRLLRVELTRLRWRRAVRILVLAAFLIVGFTAAVTIWDTRPVSPEDLSSAEAQLAKEMRQPYVQEQLDDCLADPEQYLGPGANTDGCEAATQPQLEWFIQRQQLGIATVVEEASPTLTYTLISLLMLSAATYAGADWNSGSMSNQLLFISRRGRVWLAKALAVALTAAVIAALALAVFWGLLWWTASTRDIETSEEVWRQLGGIAGRTVALCAVAAVGGYALTMLFRSTVATLGLLFAVSVVGSILIQLIPIAGIGRWGVGPNVSGVLLDGAKYFDYSLCRDSTEECNAEQILTLGEGVRYLSAMAVLAVGLSWWSFRRREIP